MLKVKFLRAGAKAPTVAHPGEDLGYDIFAAETVTFAPRGSALVPTAIAVELTSKLSHPTLYEFLRKADVKLPQPESFYGLALPLGGAEVSMQDLVRLYAALANNGELRPLRHVTRDPISKGRRILSPEASFLTLEMLRNVPRPEMNCADAAGSASAPSRSRNRCNPMKKSRASRRK